MILDEILKRTEERVAVLRAEMHNPAEIDTCKPISLKDAIASAKGKNAVIAEIKCASPSKGIICKGMNVAEVSRALVDGGCIALSVLTEPYFFGGSTDNLLKARSASSVPILRKDFVIDEMQIYEAKALKADAVLLIAGVLRSRLPHFVDLSYEVGLEPLVEVHNQEDVAIALGTDAEILGINNRDLRSMRVDLETTKKLSRPIRDQGRLVVSESGISLPEDIRALKGYCNAFLIGSAIMSSEDPGKMVRLFACA